MKYIFAFVLVFIGLDSSAQEKYDNNWVFGANSSPQIDYPFFGSFRLNFDDYELSIFMNDTLTYIDRFDNSSTCYSNIDGKLLYSTNGKKLIDNLFKLIPNGDSLNFGPAWISGGSSYNSPDGVMAIPEPGNEDNGSLLIHRRMEYSSVLKEFIGQEIYQTKIDVSDPDDVKVLFKNKSIHSGNSDQFNLTKHANGRDWWLLIPQKRSSRIERYLIQPNGIIQKPSYHLIQDTIEVNTATPLFTPDGSKFITSNVVRKVVCYDFDRCDGLLSSPKVYEMPDTLRYGFNAISKNSRFLYMSDARNILQFDLNAAVLKPDTVSTFELIYDEKGTYVTYTYMQLAPDGKIYIASFGSSLRLSVIESPDEQGKACKVLQGNIKLPTYNYASMNRFPNYRLGPLDGSSCDTLGLNNIPLAKYRYSVDTAALGYVRFHDLTDYNPKWWWWDFGDGGYSDQQNPQHTFTNAGTYKVCLTASNEFGSSSYCRDISFNTVSVVDEPKLMEFKLTPNPVRDILNVSINFANDSNTEVSIINSLGLEVMRSRINLVNKYDFIDVSSLPSGLYVAVTKVKGNYISGKFIKQ